MNDRKNRKSARLLPYCPLCNKRRECLSPLHKICAECRREMIAEHFDAIDGFARDLVAWNVRLGDRSTPKEARDTHLSEIIKDAIEVAEAVFEALKARE